MSEEIRRKLQNREHELEKLYQRLRGRIEGLRSVAHGEIQKTFLELFQLLLDAKKGSHEDTFAILDVLVGFRDRIIRLETTTNELRQDINQLRETLDRLGEMR